VDSPGTLLHHNNLRGIERKKNQYGAQIKLLRTVTDRIKLFKLTAKISSISDARDAVRDLVHHVIASIRVILFDQLLAGGALLRPARGLPGLQRLVVCVHGAAVALVPGLLAADTEILVAVGTDHASHMIHALREIDVILAVDTPHPWQYT
jgi:hypothetical protein